MMLFLVILSASFSSAKPKWSLIEVEDNDGVDDNEEVLEVKNDVEGDAKGDTDYNNAGRLPPFVGSCGRGF